MFNCGGNYTNTTNAGVFYSNGNNNTRTNTNTNIGFRSALPRPKGQMPGGYGSPVKQAHRPHPMRRIREAKDSSSVPSLFGGQKSQTVAVGGPEAPATPPEGR